MTTPNRRPSAPPNRYTTQLLVDLLSHPLDPGYAAAHERRAGGPPSRPWLDRTAVTVGALLVGFTLAVAWVHTHRSAPQTAKVHKDLVTRVQAAEDSTDRLQSQAQRLSGQINQLRNSALANSGLSAQINRSQLLAGETAVTGPGIEVVLKDPPAPTATPSAQRGGTVSINQTNSLTDRDVRSVVNELWADGAEAIAVNGIRLTPTSAIRFAGQAVLVDFQPVTSPYTIRAIGNADALSTTFASSEVASRYQTLVSADGIGFSFSEHARMTLPAGSAPLPRFAAVPSSGATR
jgi:uncharacterized protein YlxW (UPF0749 family)